ncbi:hypothetical protein SAMN04488031_11014 [Roseovarius indicus]|nr:hypothetical protein SAMN04488031_11014 [Roseovarius indicus]
MIVTAIDAKNASGKSGIIPKIVVPAARTTGRKRLTEPSTIALYSGTPSARCWSISSTRTIAFFINIPERDRNPRSAVVTLGALFVRKQEA